MMVQAGLGCRYRVQSSIVSSPGVVEAKGGHRGTGHAVVTL